MPLGTLDRTAPPLFNQGPSALSKLIFFSALAAVPDGGRRALSPRAADPRWRSARCCYPVQWLALKPVQLVVGGGRYLEDLQTAQGNEAEARKALALQSERASQADTLAQENARLRSLLELRQTTQTPGRAAEVLYDAADPYTRKLVIDQGLTNGIAPGSPVIDERGVLGQVTQVQPFSSEVTLVIDRDLAIPVQNTRTGARSVAFGDASAHGGGLELRFMAGQCRPAGGRPARPPAASTASTRRACRWPRSTASSAAPIRPSPASIASRWPRSTAARYVLVLAPTGAQSAPKPPPAARPRRSPPAQEGRQGRRQGRCQGGRQGRQEGRQEGSRSAMIMRPGQQQLLLPVSPLFMWTSLVVALLVNMVPIGRAAWTPDLLALVIVFWSVHQPARVGIGAAFVFGLLHGRAPGRHARAACAVLHHAGLLRRP